MVECAFSVPYNMNGLSFDVIIEILSNSMMKSSRANLSEGDELFTTDPTVNEKNRIYSCEEKEYFLKCVQEYHRKLFNTENDANTNDVLIPCRIRYSLLGICSSSTEKGVQAKFSLENSGPMRLDRHSMPPPSWIALGRNDNLMALVASTLWFSLDSGREVWSICNDSKSEIHESKMYHEGSKRFVGPNLFKCYAYQSKRCWRRFKELLRYGSYCEAYQSLYVTILLSPKWDLAAPIIRMALSVPSCLMSVMENIDMIQDILVRDDLLSMNRGMIGRSIHQNISVKIRAICMSPSMVHLRGGCILLLKTLEKIESSLQLELRVDAGSNMYTLLGQAFATPTRILNALNMLKDLHSMCKLFKHMLEKDLHKNCSFELEDVYEKFPGLVVDLAKTSQSDLSHSDFSTIARRLNILQSVKKVLSRSSVIQEAVHIDSFDEDLKCLDVRSVGSSNEPIDKSPVFMNYNRRSPGDVRIETNRRTKGHIDGNRLNLDDEFSVSVASKGPSVPTRKVQSIVNMLSFIRTKFDIVNLKELRHGKIRAVDEASDDSNRSKKSRSVLSHKTSQLSSRS